MITIINGTNRAGALTSLVTNKVLEIFQEEGIEAQVVDLGDLPSDVLHTQMYDASKMSPELKQLQETKLLSVHKWIVISPEYNGSIPGVLKLFWDAISINEYKKTFKAKTLGLIGVASGRAGNLRGLDHFAAIANHVGMSVYPDKRPISQITKFLNEDKSAVVDAGLIDGLRDWCKAYAAYQA